MSTSFRCPFCYTPHRTLRALLLCHPRELRALTDELADGANTVSLTRLLGGDCPRPLWQRAHARLHPTIGEEPAA